MEDFVTFELAKKLKEKGFREKCLLHYSSTGGFYSNSIDTYDRPNQELDYSDFLKCFNEGNSIGLIDAPTISQVLKWLRDEKKLHISIEYGYAETPIWDFEIRLIGDYGRWWDDTTYSSYEAAAIAGIEYTLENLI